MNIQVYDNEGRKCKIIKRGHGTGDSGTDRVEYPDGTTRVYPSSELLIPFSIREQVEKWRDEVDLNSAESRYTDGYCHGKIDAMQKVLDLIDGKVPV